MRTRPPTLGGGLLSERDCTLQIVCYNADTTCNKLSHKGLPVTRTRLFRTLRLICALAAISAVALPATSAAQTTSAARRSTGTAKPAAKAPVKKAAAPKTTPKTTAASRARARRAAAARARAAAAVRAAREAQEPRFKLDDTGALVPDLRAEAAIIYNPENGQILWESNANAQRSIASITKVMTALVFMESNPDLSQVHLVTAADTRAASTTYLRTGYRVTADNLLHLLLIASDNAAARALARVSPYGTQGFIARMTEKAKELGLQNTTYADPSGLLSANVSSAYDMAKLITFATQDDRIGSIMRTANYSFNVGRRTISVHSTNQLVRNGDVDVVGGKTGFIRAAGYCLATLLRLPQGGPQVAVVVLGARSNAGRFWETRHLFNWLSGKAQDLIGGAKVEAATPAAVSAN